MVWRERKDGRLRRKSNRELFERNVMRVEKGIQKRTFMRCWQGINITYKGNINGVEKKVEQREIESNER